MTKEILCTAETEFLTLKHVIYQNFIAKSSPIKEEDLTLDDLCKLIRDVGQHYENTKNKTKTRQIFWRTNRPRP